MHCTQNGKENQKEKDTLNTQKALIEWIYSYEESEKEIKKMGKHEKNLHETTNNI